jgi:predicted transposase/invertase (TIGR01784 family)
MERIAGQEPMIARALTIEEIFALDEKERYRYEMREKSIARLWDIEQAAEEKGIELGEKKGEEKGIKLGEKKGDWKGRAKVARNLLGKGLSIADIADATEFSVEEIEKLRS